MRQIIALASLAFREGLRMKLLWTVLILALAPGAYAYFYSDGDGTHAGRAKLILNTCITSGEVLGACLVVLLAALSVAREIESRIMHTLGAKPVPRWAILAGKALGFWAIDLCFLAVLIGFSALLVRAVPWRPETRLSKLAQSGTWEDLKRNALTMRTFTNAQDSGGRNDLVFIKPGKSRAWTFSVPPTEDGETCRAVRFSISSTHAFSLLVQGVRIVASEPGKRTIFDRTETVPQGKPFEFYLTPEQCPRNELLVTISATIDTPGAPALIVSRPSGVRLGTDVDGFSTLLFKSFCLLALQGWVLALITTGWSGVLSFPVTVAVGLILVLGGEMSRHAIEMLSGQMDHLKSSGLSPGADSDLIVQQLKRLLGFLPDFQVAGGPASFIDGVHTSATVLGHAAFWMGLVRAFGWAIPGVLAFQRREVGK